MDKALVQEALTQLSALGFEYGDEVLLGLYAKPDKKLRAKKVKGKIPLLPIDAISKAEEEGRSVYFCVNRQYKNEDVKECRVLFYEHDNLPKEESLIAWQSIGLPEPTLQVDTGGKSVHTYYLLESPIPPDLWRSLQQGFIHHLKSDPSLHNPGRVMRLAGSIHPDTGEVARIVHRNEAAIHSVETFSEVLAIHEVGIPRIKTDEEMAVEYLNHMGSSVADEYESWVRVGMALKAVSPNLLPEWIRWSSQSPKSVGTNFEEKWNSFKGNGVGIGTLWHYAYNFGTWKSSKPKTTHSETLPIGSGTPQSQATSAFRNAVDGVSSFLGNSLKYNLLSNTYVLNGIEIGINDAVSYVEYNYRDLPRFKERAIVDSVANKMLLTQS